MMPGWSPYSYSFNNPVVFVDPDGQLPLPIITGLIGAAGGAIYGLASGKSWKETAALAAGGFVAGATLGFGTATVGAAGGVAAIGGAGTAYIYGASGIIGAGLGNLTEQGARNMLGAQDGFNEDEFVMSLMFAVPETILSKRITEPIGKSIKNSIARELAKENTIKQQQQLIKQTAKSIKKLSGGELTNRLAKIAAQKLYNTALETEQEVINATIHVTDKSVDVTTVIIEKIIMEPIKEGSDN